MVDSDVLSRRLLTLTECLTELARPGAADAAALAREPMLRAAVERWLQVAVEACIDIATHVVANEGWTPWSSPGWKAERESSTPASHAAATR